MSVHGCHNCQVDLSKYAGKAYQDTPCATCRLVTQPTQTHKRTQLFQSDILQQEADAIDQTQNKPTVPDWVPASAIKLIKQACQANMMVTLSNLILKLVVMAKEHPAMFQVLILKMQHRQMSYYDIGRAMTPQCSKQNVLYHLKHAVEQLPQLVSAIIVDTRFSSGHYAIKTVADIMQALRTTAQTQHRLYPKTQMNTVQTVAELNKLFTSPWLSQDKIISDYDPYCADQSAMEVQDGDKDR